MLVNCFTHFSSHLLKIDLHVSHHNLFSPFFIDNQSHLLIWKHTGSVDKDKGLVIKGFLGMSKVIYCNSYKGYTYMYTSTYVHLVD